ncbi:MAG: hypothetical protein MUF87_09500 [Anaerolineae bacterium]|jgi:hypothetical protein|nr:hypothetical protein [Anaerolineae bacterium]
MNRYEATIALWGIFALLATLTIIFAGANVVALGILGFAAVIATLAINDNPSEKASKVEKLKNEDRDSFNAMMNLLDEDDRAELRQRLKVRLMNQIEQGRTDGEITSLEALLAEDRQQQRK